MREWNIIILPNKSLRLIKNSDTLYLNRQILIIKNVNKKGEWLNWHCNVALLSMFNKRLSAKVNSILHSNITIFVIQNTKLYSHWIQICDILLVCCLSDTLLCKQNSMNIFYIKLKFKSWKLLIYSIRNLLNFIKVCFSFEMWL